MGRGKEGVVGSVTHGCVVATREEVARKFLLEGEESEEERAVRVFKVHDYIHRKNTRKERWD